MVHWEGVEGRGLKVNDVLLFYLGLGRGGGGRRECPGWGEEEPREVERMIFVFSFFPDIVEDSHRTRTRELRARLISLPCESAFGVIIFGFEFTVGGHFTLPRSLGI